MKILFFFLTILSFQALAFEEAKELESVARPGDVLLVELACHSCQFIADETGGPFSHSGLLVFSSEGEFRLVESISKVSTVDLKTFLDRVPPGGKIALMRHREFSAKRADVLNQKFRRHLLKYMGAPFDYQYLWDNYDANGREKLYCSELLAKLLNNELTEKIRPKPMDFSKNWSFWHRYYQGKVPQGKLGNSPNSFFFDPNFFVVFQNF